MASNLYTITFPLCLTPRRPKNMTWPQVERSCISQVLCHSRRLSQQSLSEYTSRRWNSDWFIQCESSCFWFSLFSYEFNESRKSGMIFVLSKICSTQSKSSILKKSLFPHLIQNMHQENGSSVNNSSERELNQETYIPYSQRHWIHPENKFSPVLNHIERVVWIDIDQDCIADQFICNDHFMKLAFKNGINIFIDEFTAHIFHQPATKEEWIFRVIVKLPEEVFFNVYQPVLSGIRKTLAAEKPFS